MWRNAEVHDFVAWLRAHNEGLPPERRAEFRGLDVYSLDASIEAVLRYLDEIDPEAAKEARGRYGCLTPWQAEPARYGRAVLAGEKQPCEAGAARRSCRSCSSRRLRLRRRRRRGVLRRGAERAHRRAPPSTTTASCTTARPSPGTCATGTCSTRSQACSSAAAPSAKAVVWAHNSHIGNAAATAMGWQGEFNIGELCRTAYRRRGRR